AVLAYFKGDSPTASENEVTLSGSSVNNLTITKMGKNSALFYGAAGSKVTLGESINLVGNPKFSNISTDAQVLVTKDGTAIVDTGKIVTSNLKTTISALGTNGGTRGNAENKGTLNLTGTQKAIGIYLSEAIGKNSTGATITANEEFMSSPKLDNLASVYTGLLGLVEEEASQDQINIFVAFDNEEIGSATKQGADSNYLLNTLERIALSLGLDRSNFLQMLENSFILSADAAHAAHPAHLEKTDPTNRGKINEGISIKISAKQKYTSDGYSIAVIRQLIKGTDIRIQPFVNESNELGGSTIGPLSSTHLDIDGVDLGVPMFAMHSVRELCGIFDVFYLKELAKEFFSKG
ncbi:MAG: hypothetical protein ACFNUP_05855, partial [Leptotrichia hofstadii]